MRASRLVLLLAAIAVGCTSRVNEEAGKRIFSPQGPPPDVLRARKRIPVAEAPTNHAVFRHIVRMDRLEAIRRAGPQHAVTRLGFTWTRPGKTVSLSERDELFADATGAFRAIETNDQDAGLEVVFVGGKAYAKSRYGPFHARRLDQAARDVWRNRSTAALSTLDELCDGRLHLSPLGDGSHDGRPVARFALELGKPWGSPEGRAGLPPVVYGKWRSPDGADHPGPDPDTARRLRFEQHRVPESATGEIEVDRATGVVLAASAHATFSVPGLPAEPTATLTYDLTFSVALDRTIHVEPPAKIVAEKLPQTPNDPLWFLGIGTANPDGGTAAPPGIGTPPGP